MDKSKIRILYLAAFILGVIGALVMQSSSGFGALVLIVAGILSAIAWIGALVNSARLKRWGWVACLVVFSALTMLAYIFVGPAAPEQVG